ncbi:MAG: hypothetical protein IPK10_18470 [Bacteroidetes bacterium]|nr:hypothetical protein [Bacteroidota bacterium]
MRKFGSEELFQNKFMIQDTGLPLPLKVRNETFGGIVTDSSRYPENYYSEFRYLARQMAF